MQNQAEIRPRDTPKDDIETEILEARTPATDRVDPRFVERWSPRAFADQPVPDQDLQAVFEAARWAPSSYNEQPWRFVYATRQEDRERFLEAILPGNRAWAQDAPVLVYVVAKITFERNGKPNGHAWFDTGAAWMSLSLQARQLGLHTHAMGGIEPAKAAEILELPDDHEVVCALAIGYRAPPETLPHELAEQEVEPSDRKAMEEIVREGSFGGP